MRSYLIQEINNQDMPRILEKIKQEAFESPVEGLFWLALPGHLLSSEQSSHSADCGPHYMALETGPDWIKLELLIRCKQKIRCDCICYALPEQREHMINFLDQLIRNQDVRV
ncbi:hypothetical protein [Desulfonatronovibrio hydrogenovorans]|uniref:hypothetical protein n=1 Tax=Desulfonatronovibrio hydrogenovorans TaxID=53245 RepID=UPI00048DD108|nr:hypothetical protein [Desulfonatronovibrio hydrogenovorans]